MFPLGNHLYGSIDSSVQQTKYYGKKVSTLTSFSKEIFSIYFEHNRNSIES